LVEPSREDSPPHVTRVGGAHMARAMREALETILLALLTFALLRGAFHNFRVQGHSMEPNIHDGQFLIVSKLVYRLHPPQRGDIIVFRAPLPRKVDYIKRVIGLPGETVEIRDGKVYIDDQPLVEPYILYPAVRSWGPVCLGEDQFIVLGDNRRNSSDSRNWGPLPRKNIIGKALFCYWPPSDWGPVPHQAYESITTHAID